jgi:4-aminobutyrate aminotransferase-like enzyme
MSAEGGAQDVLDWLGGTASNAIRVSDPLIIEASDADQAADRLYRAHIDKEHDA